MTDMNQNNNNPTKNQSQASLKQDGDQANINSSPGQPLIGSDASRENIAPVVEEANSPKVGNASFRQMELGNDQRYTGKMKSTDLSTSKTKTLYTYQNKYPRVGDFNPIGQPKPKSGIQSGKLQHKREKQQMSHVNTEPILEQLVDNRAQSGVESTTVLNKKVSQVVNQLINSKDQVHSQAILENPSEIYAMSQVIEEHYRTSHQDLQSKDGLSQTKTQQQDKMKNLNSIYKSQNALGSARTKDKKLMSKQASNTSSFVNLSKTEYEKMNRAKGGMDMKKNYSSALLKNPETNLASSGVTEKVGDNNVIQSLQKKKYIQFSSNSGLASNQNLSMYSKKSNSKLQKPQNRSSMNSDLFDKNMPMPAQVDGTSPQQPASAKKTKNEAAKSHLTDQLISRAKEGDQDMKLTLQDQKQSQHIASAQDLGNKEYYAISEMQQNEKQVEDFKMIHEITDNVEKILTEAKFDICAWGSSTSYNSALFKEGLLQEGKLRALPEDCLVIVAGNTLNIWDTIQQFKKESGSENPFEDYAIKVATQIQEQYERQKINVAPRYPTELSPERLISFTRLVSEVPFGEGAKCYFQNDAHLLFHEKYGNWHAWRFALVFENIFLSPVPKDYQAQQYIAHQKLATNQIQLQISDKETKAALEILKQIEQLEMNANNTPLWLGMRQVFSLGRKYMYPKEMLLYHYKQLEEKYFEESNKIMSEHNYSDEYSKEFEQAFTVGADSAKRRDKSMNSTAPVNLKGMGSPEMHVNNEVLSEPPLDGKPGHSPVQTRGQQATEQVYSSNYDESSAANIFEKSPRATSNNTGKSASTKQKMDTKQSFQQDDFKKQLGSDYASPYDSMKENEKIRIQNEDEKTGEVLASSAFIPSSPQQFNQHKQAPMLNDGAPLQPPGGDVANSLYNKFENIQRKQREIEQNMMTQQMGNFNINSQIQKYESKIQDANQRGSLKFQFINKQQQKQQKNHTPTKVRNANEISYGYNADDTTVVNNMGMSTNRITDTTPRDGVEPSLFTSKLDFNQVRPSTQANRGPHFVNTMRKSNIKYPFNYQKRKQFLAPMDQSNICGNETNNPSSPNGVSSIEQANTLQPTNQQETFEHVNNTQNGPVTSKSQATVGVAHRPPKPNQGGSNQSSMYNLSKITQLRNSQSNYMGRKRQQQQQQTGVSVHDFLNSQMSKRIRSNTNQSKFYQSNKTTIHMNNSNISAMINESRMQHGTHRAYDQNPMSDGNNSNSRSPMYRNRFMPKFYKAINRPSIMGLTADAGVISRNDDQSFTDRGINEDAHQQIIDESLMKDVASSKQQQYIDEFSSKPPFKMYGSLVINKEPQQSHPGRDLTAQELKQRFQSTYAGISKNEIVRLPPNEIYNQIKRNLSHQSKEMNEMKVKRMKQKIALTQEYLRIKKFYDIAKKRYLRNKDDDSLKLYQNWQEKLNMWQMGHQGANLPSQREAPQFFEMNEHNRSMQSSYNGALINKRGSHAKSDYTGGNNVRLLNLNPNSVKADIESRGTHNRDNSPMIPPIVAESSNSISQQKITPMSHSFVVSKARGQQNPKVPSNDNSISRIYCKQGTNKNIAKAKSNQLLNQKLGHQVGYNSNYDNHSKFLNKRTQKYVQDHVNESSEVYDPGMDKSDNDASGPFLRNIQDGEAQREGLQTAPAGSKKRRTKQQGHLPDVNPIDDYQVKAVKAPQEAMNNNMFQNTPLNVISEYADGDKTNVVTYSLPEHDMSLDFKSRILQAHPDNLGQEEPNVVTRVISQLEKEQELEALQYAQTKQASKYYKHKKNCAITGSFSQPADSYRKESQRNQSYDIIKDQQV